jgi:integrase
MSGAYGRKRAPERACLKAAEWPTPDRLLWEHALRQGDPLEPGGERCRYAAISNRKVERGYGRWLTFLSNINSLDPTETPAHRITRDRVIAYVNSLETIGNGTQTVLARLQELYEAALVMGPETDWSWIRRIASRVRARHVPVRDKRIMIVPDEELVELGLRMMDNADKETTDRQRAITFRDGLIIALLAMRPAMRRRNIAALELERHVLKLNDTWIVAFAELDTKTGAALEFPWPDILVPALNRWLDRWRPVLANLRGRWYRPSGKALWISSHGSPFTEQAIYDRITQRTRAAFGKSINPHLFRDCAATTLAYADPKHIGIAAPLLGHRSFATTERHYLQARMGEASRRLQQDLLELRHRRGA